MGDKIGRRRGDKMEINGKMEKVESTCRWPRSTLMIHTQTHTHTLDPSHCFTQARAHVDEINQRAMMTEMDVKWKDRGRMAGRVH